MVGEHHENCATPTAHLVSPLPPVSPLPLVSPGLPRAGSPDFDDEHPIKHRAQHQKRSDLKSSFLLAFHPPNLPKSPLNLPKHHPNLRSAQTSRDPCSARQSPFSKNITEPKPQWLRVLEQIRATPGRGKRDPPPTRSRWCERAPRGRGVREPYAAEV